VNRHAGHETRFYRKINVTSIAGEKVRTFVPAPQVCFRWKSGDAYDVEIVDYH